MYEVDNILDGLLLHEREIHPLHPSKAELERNSLMGRCTSIVCSTDGSGEEIEHAVVLCRIKATTDDSDSD